MSLVRKTSQWCFSGSGEGLCLDLHLWEIKGPRGTELLSLSQVKTIKYEIRRFNRTQLNISVYHTEGFSFKHKKLQLSICFLYSDKFISINYHLDSGKGEMEEERRRC